ncbi:aldo/keto reductase family protein [Aliarcobacter butzleri]|uniref:aldo/keto reductase family protein n=1 Tax=Aliarcobacter butzleri TaxID=28197 RepID=UPI0021B3B32C|nr:aldo/keto reductase [Aliarcobacter butzleri]MCT7625547.1 aldo/keto reductase [Aliarcobacter butzleri]MCT7636129.1 aldo/keto reductase [Aliarcobacter butzleri]MCT7642591.1 aldo/keto reductase [Aliarcobacter butzleri]MDK2046050.1 aldo/keto reductase [Aliarcobacter butzleri]UXC30406.1 aldo/keto reductase [Aliarcobacter butzleri]
MKIPNMIYGTAWKKENTTALVFEALKQGFRAVDTACQPRHYREDLVGLGLQKAYDEQIVKREDLFIQTKFTPIDGQDKNNMPYLKSDEIEIQVEKSFETSKKNLKTNFIDAYILHSPVYPENKLQKVWQKMEGFVDAREVGQLGISNCYDLDILIYIYSNAKIKPSIVQNRFYAQSGYDKEIRAFCTENSIKYESFWSLTANPHILTSEILQTLSQKYQRGVAEIFYRFLNHINITPLNGTTSTKHMIEDLKISQFELTNDEINSILNLL